MNSKKFLDMNKIPYRKITVIVIKDKDEIKKIPFGEFNNMKEDEIKSNRGIFKTYKELKDGLIFYLNGEKEGEPMDVRGSWKQLYNVVKNNGIKNFTKDCVKHCFSVYLKYSPFSVIDIDDIRYLEDENIVPEKLRNLLIDCNYDLSLSKNLPHYWVQFTNLSEDLSNGKGEIKTFEDFDADILNYSRALWLNKDSLIYGKHINKIDFNDIVEFTKKPVVSLIKTNIKNKSAVKNFEPSINVDGKDESDELKFYLSCIPNSKENILNYDEWIRVGFICYNATNGGEYGLNCFCEFTQKAYEKRTIEELKEELTPVYENLSRHSGKKLTIGTLINMAKEYVPECVKIYSNIMLNNNIKKLYNDFDNVDIYNEEYVKKCPLNKFDYWIEQCKMGGGKTYAIKQYIKNNNDTTKRILYFSPRILFSKNLMWDLEKLGFKNYKDIKNKNDLCRYERLIISMESLHYLKDCGEYDLIIIDEVETLLYNFNSQTNKQLRDNIYTFENTLKNAKKIAFMDAFISKKTVNFIKDLGLNTKKLIARANVKPYELKTCVRVDKYDIENHIKQSVEQNKKIVLFSNSVNIADSVFNNLVVACTDKKIKYYYGNMKDSQYGEKNDLYNVNESWKDVDILIYTPTITVGVSFEIPEHFNHIYMICVNTSCVVRDCFQSYLRARYLKDKTLFYKLISKKTHTKIENNKLSSSIKEDDVIEYMNETKKITLENFNKDKQNNNEISIVDMPLWLKNIYVNSKVEINKSRKLFDLIFNEYLRKLNFTASSQAPEKYGFIKTIEPVVEEKIDDEEEKDYYNEIELIDEESFNSLKKLKMEGNLTKDLMPKYLKYSFYQKFYSFDEKAMAYYFNNYYYNNGRLSEKSREFMDIYLIRNGFTSFTKNEIASKGVAELVKEKYAIFEHVENIRKFLNIPSLNEFEYDKTYKNNSLNSVFINNNIKTLKNLIDKCKYSSKIQIKEDSKAVVANIKSLLKYYYGIILKAKKYNIKGTRKNHSIYSIYLDIEGIHKFDLKKYINNNPEEFFICE
jgi:hypothetical protein